jgi:hypothetical protein
MRFIYLILFLFVFNWGNAQILNDSIAIKNIFNEVMAHSTAHDNLYVLCKRIGARLSGSLNAEKAVLATAKMLKAAGADTVYLQSCEVPHWVRGEKETGFVLLNNGKKQDLNLCALGNAVATEAKGVKGKVIEITSMHQLDSLGEKVIKGKIVFFNIPMNPTYLNTFKAYGESGVARWDGPSNAAKYGAIAAIVRSLASNADNYPHTGVLGYNDSFPKIPAVAISTNDANWLNNMIQQQGVKEIWFKTSSKMLPDVTSHNVIAEIRGTLHPEEIITVGGHLDSWDLAEGAQDDGAGCVQSIEVLRALQAIGYHPKRTIRVVMFMNEENGGRGGEAYLNQAKRLNEKHIFALESDEGGFTPRGFNCSMNQEKKEKLMKWKSLFYPYGIDRFEGNGSGSDIEQLSEVGAALCGLSPDSQRYFDYHHAANDIFENVSKRELDLGAFAMTALIYLVAENGL